MNEALRRYVEAASGLTTVTKERAEQIVKQLVRSGGAASDQVGELVDQLLERQRKNQEAVASLVRSETNRAIRAMGLASREEVERLRKQVAELKREVATMSPAGGGPGGTGAKKTAKKAGKKTPTKAAKKRAKKTAKKAAKKGTKATAKTTAKKGAKKTAKKTTTEGTGGGTSS